MAIQIALSYSGPYVSYSPFVSVRFVGEAYEDPLEFSDFRPFALFADFECGECEFDGAGAPRYSNSDETKDFVGMVQFGYRLNPGDDLWVRFYELSGFDSGKLRETIERFLQFLRTTDEFAAGYELYEGYGEGSDSRRILASEESSWLSGRKLP